MFDAEDVIKKDLKYICHSLREELEQLEGKKVLITGGAGFLGYYLVQSLLFWNDSVQPESSIEVTVYDNYMRGIPDWLHNLKGNNHLNLVKHDVTKPLPDSIPDFQYVIHAASIASPIYYRKHPIETMDANVNGLRYLLEYSLEQKRKNVPVEGFLFYSTSEIYGDPDPDNIPTSETYRGNVSCTGPRACYDESKRFGETLCVNFAAQFDLPISIARPFNNYGPGLKITDKRVISDFAGNLLENQNVVLLSDGSPTRTFCYIADAIVGYLKILVKGRPGESYNIGVSSPEISIKELAKKMIDLAKEIDGYSGELIFEESKDTQYLVDNPNRRCPDITKAKEELNYIPKIDLEEGLKRSYLWYKENQEAVEA